MGVIGAIVSIGIVVGPALGGIIIGAFSWRWIFYVNLPVGLAGTWLARRYVPDFKPAKRQPFDYGGALTLFAGLLCLLLGLTLGQQQGFAHPLAWLLFGGWAAGSIAFVWFERRVSHPMISPGLFTNPLFGINLATGFMCFVALAGVLILMPFYLENILGFDTIHVGLLMGIVPVMLGLTAPLAGALSDRVGTRPMTAIGMGVLLGGYLAASTLTVHTSAAGYMLRMFAVGAGMGLFVSPNNSAIMGTAQRQQLGVVSGLMAITRTLGQTVGVAVMGALWAGRSAAHTGTSLPGGATLAPVAAQIAALQDTFRAAALLLALALLLGLWAWLQEQRQQRALAKYQR